jgi:hypothetical protein
MWATWPRSASSGYYAQIHEGFKQTSSSGISVYYAEFQEGKALSEDDRVAAWHV